jgi:IS5 family transposase
MLRIHCMQHWYNLSDGHGRCPVRNRLHAPVCPIIPG